MATITYTGGPVTITRSPGVAGDANVTLALTSGTLPANPFCTQYTVTMDYVYEVSGTESGGCNVVAGPGPGGCGISVPIYGGASSNSGHVSATSQLIPTGHIFFSGGGVGNLYANLSLSTNDSDYSLRLTLSNVVVTATVGSGGVPVDPPPPPPGGGSTAYYALEVLNKPYLASGGSIAGNIEQVFSPLGNRDLAGISAFKIEIVTPTAQDTPIAAAFFGTAVQTKTATLVGGVAAFSEALNAALLQGEWSDGLPVSRIHAPATRHGSDRHANRQRRSQVSERCWDRAARHDWDLYHR